MNRVLPPGDCGHRDSDPCGTSGPTGIVLSFVGLVCRVAAAEKECATNGAPQSKDRPGGT